MLPGIDAQDGAELADDRVLVRVCLNLDAACLGVLHQPCPSTALDTCQRCVELLLERIEATIAIVDSLAESTRGRLASALAGRRQVLPEQAMVDMTTAVEVDQGLQSNLGLDVLLGLRFGDLLTEVVEGGHVCVVVVLVVELHDFAGDGGFESAIVVWVPLSLASTRLQKAERCVHGRSGRVAFPRMNVEPARPAREALGAALRTAERRADVRRRVVFMVGSIDSIASNKVQMVPCVCMWMRV